MQILAQIVDGIKAVKYWAWEEDFYERITTARDEEAEHLSRYRTLQGFIGQLGRACPPICTFASLWVYSATEETFSAKDVFATLAIFQALRAITIIVRIHSGSPWVVHFLL